jgi:hypothetical protein
VRAKESTMPEAKEAVAKNYCPIHNHPRCRFECSKCCDDLPRLRLVERVTLGLNSTEGRSLAVAAIEAVDAMNNNLAPGPWGEVKRALLDAAIAFEKATRRRPG